MFKLKYAPLNNLNVSSPFGLRDYDSAWWHNGIDFSCPTGTPIYAVADGKVMECKDGGTYGNYIAIWHGGAGSLYAHLSSFVICRGDQVKAGDIIGYSGTTGKTSRPHLHFEIRLCSSYDEFWERCKLDNGVFMRCVDPRLFIDDYYKRISLGLVDANKAVQAGAGLDDNTMTYLNFYKYDKHLITKLAKAII